MSAHTPGPWTAVPSYRPARAFEEYGTTIFAPSGDDPAADRVVAWIRREPSRPQYAADVALIAAAPELLVALKGALHLIEADYHTRTDPQEIASAAWRIDRARAAITKATGEA